MFQDSCKILQEHLHRIILNFATFWSMKKSIEQSGLRWKKRTQKKTECHHPIRLFVYALQQQTQIEGLTMMSRSYFHTARRPKRLLTLAHHLHSIVVVWQKNFFIKTKNCNNFSLQIAVKNCDMCFSDLSHSHDSGVWHEKVKTFSFEVDRLCSTQHCAKESTSAVSGIMFVSASSRRRGNIVADEKEHPEVERWR